MFRASVFLNTLLPIVLQSTTTRASGVLAEGPIMPASGTSGGKFGPYYFEYCSLNATELSKTVATHIPSNPFARHAYEDCAEIIVQPVRSIEIDNNPCNTRTLETTGDQRIEWAARGCEHEWKYWGDIENGGDPYLKMKLKAPPFEGWYGESQGVACKPLLY